MSDCAIFAGVTAISFPIGWVSGVVHTTLLTAPAAVGSEVLCAGLSSKVPIPSMWTAASLGGLAGFMMAYQNSTGGAVAADQ